MKNIEAYKKHAVRQFSLTSLIIATTLVAYLYAQYMPISINKKYNTLVVEQNSLLTKIKQKKTINQILKKLNITNTTPEPIQTIKHIVTEDFADLISLVASSFPNSLITTQIEQKDFDIMSVVDSTIDPNILAFHKNQKYDFSFYLFAISVKISHNNEVELNNIINFFNQILPGYIVVKNLNLSNNFDLIEKKMQNKNITVQEIQNEYIFNSTIIIHWYVPVQK